MCQFCELIHVFDSHPVSPHDYSAINRPMLQELEGAALSAPK